MSTNATHAPVRAESVQTPDRSPWLILMVLCAAIFMLLLDTTIVNVAQREIQLGLGADLSQIQWVLDSYILTYAVLLLSCGRLGDVFGRKRLFVFGMALFTAASGLCAASGWLGDQLGVSGVNALIFARVLQGLGGAFMMPQTLSLISVAFPPEKRGAAMGIWGAMVALGAVVGPIVGGLIVTDYAWEWIFLINIPIGIGAILATLAIVPESVDPRATKRIDWGGLVLSGTGIFALVFAAIEGADLGWTSPTILTLGIVGTVLLVLFVWWERRDRDPMMKIELFAQRNFWVASVVTLVVSFGMFGIFFPMTLFLQGALGFTPIRAGLTLVPMSAALMVAAPVAGRLSDRIGARWILVAGLGLMTAGIGLIIASVDTDTTWRSLLPSLVVTGAGMGMTFAPMTAAAMRDVPARIAGSASGIINTMRNVGQVLGIAILGSLLRGWLGVEAEDELAGVGLDGATEARVVELVRDSRFEDVGVVVRQADPSLIGPVIARLQEAFVAGLQTTFWVSVAACLVALLVSFLIRNPAAADGRGSRPERGGGFAAGCRGLRPSLAGS
jgi:EmrB/QacA subfamily drug resistance transporter